jgi:hypothetical protein
MGKILAKDGQVQDHWATQETPAQNLNEVCVDLGILMNFHLLYYC